MLSFAEGRLLTGNQLKLWNGLDFIRFDPISSVTDA
jgi:hypothetical protein